MSEVKAKKYALVRLGRHIAWHHKRRMIFMATCIAVGIAFLFSIGNLLTTIESAVTGQAKKILTADLEITSYRPFTKADQALIQGLRNQGCRITRLACFASMASSPAKNASFLVNVRAIEKDYPLYGKIEVDPPSARKSLKARTCLIEKSIGVQQRLVVGDSLRLGGTVFEIVGIIASEPGLFGAFSIAPSVVIPYKQAKATGLLDFGSRIRYSSLIAMPAPASHEALENLKLDLQKRIAAPQVRITTYRDAQKNIRELLQRQSSFFVLVSIVTLLVGAVGMSASVTTFLNEQLETVGTLRCLGLEPKQIFRLYLGLCLAMGLFGGLLGCALGALLDWLGVQALESSLGIGVSISLRFHWQYLLEALILACALTVGLNVYKLRSLTHISPMEILRGKATSIRFSIGSSLLTSALALAVLTLYSYYRAHDWKLALLFSLSLVLVIGIGVALILVALKSLGVVSTILQRGILLRNGLRQLVRNRARTMVFLISLTIGFTLILALNLVYHSFEYTIAKALRKDAPNLFLIDVQRTQVQEIEHFLEHFTKDRVEFFPIIRARLTHINGQRLTRRKRQDMSRKEQKQYRWRIREQNLSYKDKLNDSERIVAGHFWQPGESVAQISLEKSFAKYAGLELGDMLRFDIQGIKTVSGRVTSIRAIDWVSMKANFFLVMPKKSIEDSPQTFIASLRISGKKRIAQFQKALAQKYPHVSVINASKIVESVQKLLRYFLNALNIIAWFCVAVGLLILIGTIAIGHRERLDQVALLRTLGLKKRQIVLIDTWEFFGIGLITAGISTALSLALAFVITYYMELELVLYPRYFAETLLILAMPIAVGLTVNWKTYGAGVMANLRNEM